MQLSKKSFSISQQIHGKITHTKEKNSIHFMNEMYRIFVSSNVLRWMCVCIQQLAFYFYHEIFHPLLGQVYTLWVEFSLELRRFWVNFVWNYNGLASWIFFSYFHIQMFI